MPRLRGDDLAFPILDRQNLRGGLTKREEFAKAAMQGILSNPHEGQPDQPAGVAPLAVKHADALIEELNKGEE